METCYRDFTGNILISRQSLKEYSSSLYRSLFCSYLKTNESLPHLLQKILSGACRKKLLRWVDDLQTLKQAPGSLFNWSHKIYFAW